MISIETKVKGPDGYPVKTLRCRPLENTWRAKDGELPVGMMTIITYLSSPPGAQLELPNFSEVVG